MPSIFEIFSYPISDESDEAKTARASGHCAFMDRECDGGGNRDLSTIDLSKNVRLKQVFPQKEKICAGICSIQLKADASPWIVCPRRLLALNRGLYESSVQRDSEQRVFDLLEYPSGTRLGVWGEVKIKYNTELNGIPKHFDYTFDYVVMPLRRVSSTELEQITGKRWNELRRDLEKAGYSLAIREGVQYVEDFPSGIPSIIEIMTSSTSGGNKTKRTTIPMAFEDAILGLSHKAPGINFRQIWARMVSQLIVKSEVGIEWGGKTIWLMQDLLLRYMSQSTALNLHEFISEHPSEVNMLSFSYRNRFRQASGIVELSADALYAGKISDTASPAEDTHTFQDILKAPVIPPVQHLINVLRKRRMTIIVQI